MHLCNNRNRQNRIKYVFNIPIFQEPKFQPMSSTYSFDKTLRNHRLGLILFPFFIVRTRTSKNPFIHTLNNCIFDFLYFDFYTYLGIFHSLDFVIFTTSLAVGRKKRILSSCTQISSERAIGFGRNGAYPNPLI